MQKIKVWEALIVHADGTVHVMRLSGYDTRETAMQAARQRLVKGSKQKVRGCRFSHEEAV